MPHLEDLSNVLEHLGLSADVPAAQASFFMSYVEMLERGQSDDAQGVWARLANPGQPWLGSATLASTYRLAAQFAALVDMRLASLLAMHAGMEYLKAGAPFGLFLLTGLLDDQILRDRSVLPTLISPLSETVTQPGLADPVQQTYMMLAAPSRPWLRELLRQSIDQSIDDTMEHLAAHGLHPIGPQSIPLATYLTFARTMLSDQPDRLVDEAGERTISEIAGQLAEMGRIQAIRLRATMRNNFLWQNAAAPVNVVDLEYVAMCGLAMRHDPTWSERLPERTRSELESDDPLAEIPIWVMVEIDRTLPEVAGLILDHLRGPSH